MLLREGSSHALRTKVENLVADMPEYTGEPLEGKVILPVVGAGFTNIDEIIDATIDMAPVVKTELKANSNTIDFEYAKVSPLQFDLAEEKVLGSASDTCADEIVSKLESGLYTTAAILDDRILRVTEATDYPALINIMASTSDEFDQIRRMNRLGNIAMRAIWITIPFDMWADNIEEAKATDDFLVQLEHSIEALDYLLRHPSLFDCISRYKVDDDIRDVARRIIHLRLANGTLMSFDRNDEDHTFAMYNYAISRKAQAYDEQAI